MRKMLTVMTTRAPTVLTNHIQWISYDIFYLLLYFLGFTFTMSSITGTLPIQHSFLIHTMILPCNAGFIFPCLDWFWQQLSNLQLETQIQQSGRKSIFLPFILFLRFVTSFWFVRAGSQVRGWVGPLWSPAQRKNRRWSTLDIFRRP